MYDHDRKPVLVIFSSLGHLIALPANRVRFLSHQRH